MSILTLVTLCPYWHLNHCVHTDTWNIVSILTLVTLCPYWHLKHCVHIDTCNIVSTLTLETLCPYWHLKHCVHIDTWNIVSILVDTCTMYSFIVAYWHHNYNRINPLKYEIWINLLYLLPISKENQKWLVNNSITHFVRALREEICWSSQCIFSANNQTNLFPSRFSG